MVLDQRIEVCNGVILQLRSEYPWQSSDWVGLYRHLPCTFFDDYRGVCWIFGQGLVLFEL